MSVVAPGTPAPAFSLATQAGKKFTNADLDGQTTVLVFYPFAFSPVCTDQLQIYDEVLSELAEQGATLYGVSCDATYSQEAFREALNVEIEQLSDFEPKGAVCDGVRRPAPGRLPAAGAGHHRPRRRREVELRGAVARRPPRRQPHLRRARSTSDLRSAPPPPVTADDHVRGPEGAPLVIVYADFECPYCAALELRLARTDVRVCFRHFPVKAKHPRARAAAHAAEAAHEQGAFWAMHDALFADQGRLEDPHLWARADDARPRRRPTQRRRPLGADRRPRRAAVPRRAARRGRRDADPLPAGRRAHLRPPRRGGVAAAQWRPGSLTTLTKNSSIWRTTSMKRSKSTGLVT